MKAQTMNRKATLKTLYRLSKGVDEYFALFRQLSHGKTVNLLPEEVDMVQGLIGDEIHDDDMLVLARDPDISAEEEERADMDEDERNAAEWGDAFADDDDDGRLPSERFYHPNN